MIREAAKELAPVAPPVGISAGYFLGISLPQWAVILTILYTTLQILRLMPKIIGCVQCFRKAGTCDRSCKSI